MTFTDYADYERDLHRRQRIAARQAIEMMAAVIGEDGQDRDELLEYAAWVLLVRVSELRGRWITGKEKP